MKNLLFNSTFEMELRLLLLMNCEKKSQSLEWMVHMDFIICYAEQFQLPYNSLHGNNQRMYGEVSSRRMLAQEAIKGLVRKGLMEVILDDGYKFKITAVGKKYVRTLKSEYSAQYKEIAQDAIKMFKKNSDNDLIKLIQDNAMKALKEGGR